MRPARVISCPSPRRWVIFTVAPCSPAKPLIPGMSIHDSLSIGTAASIQKVSVPTSATSCACGPARSPSSTVSIFTVALNGTVMTVLSSRRRACARALWAAARLALASASWGLRRASAVPSSVVATSSDRSFHSCSATARRPASCCSSTRARVTCAAS